jgi:hypothetical protein
VSARRALFVLGAAALVLVAHEVLVRAMAHGHVAHVLLGAGNTDPPIGAAILAVLLVVTRLSAIVLVPGAILAALASLFAHVVVGPHGAADDDVGGSISGAGISVAGGTGTSIDGRGTHQ